MSRRGPFVLVICDGWGDSANTLGNAIRAAHTPHLDRLYQTWPHTTVAASGEAVGLPAGQQGNSEVGHLTIGSGRITRQALARQQHEIETGELDHNQVLLDAINLAKTRRRALHIMGLVSPGGVHSHSDAALAIARLAATHELDHVYVDAFTDGRDMPPKSALNIMQQFEVDLQTAHPSARVTSISGRYYAMDRDNRWDRIQRAYDMLTSDHHASAHSAVEYIQSRYDVGETDEFLQPMSIAATPASRVRIEDGDVVVFFNFRTDRARQLSHALIDTDFDDFTRPRVIRDLQLVTFSEYDSSLHTPVVFPKPNIEDTLSETISKQGLHQFHVAETEKYAHVTYFINGGREQPFKNEDRQLIPSLKVATYDLSPAMSAEPITDAVLQHLTAGHDDLIIVNYANADMIGHTGKFDATVAAIEILDRCLGRLVDATIRQGGGVLITADHGNAEAKIDPETKKPLTAHTANPVPVLLCGTAAESLRSGGGLQDIAPTVLAAMGLPIPSSMTGQDLAGH